jgi:ecdysteroid 25-hydroxylase CYP302A1
MESVGIELVKKKINRMQNKEDQKHVEKSLLEQYLDNPNLGMQDIVGMAADLLLAGVHTVGTNNLFNHIII